MNEIIAEAARSMPHTLCSLRLADEQLAELTMRGFDDNLAAQVTQTSNRFAACLPRSIQPLSVFLDRASTIQWYSTLLERYPSPAELAASSEKTLAWPYLLRGLKPGICRRAPSGTPTAACMAVRNGTIAGKS